MKQQRGIKIKFSRNNDNYTDYDDDEPDDIDYRMDKEGNIHGFVREITCTPGGGSTDSNFDWDRHFRGMESLGGQGGDTNGDYAVGAPATKPAQQAEKKPQTQQTAQDTAAIERGRQILNGLGGSKTSAVASEKLTEAASLLNIGIDSIKNWSVDFVKIFSKDIGVMAKVGKAMSRTTGLTGAFLLVLDVKDGKLSPQDKANIAAYTVGLATLFVSFPPAVFSIGLLSIGLSVYALTLPDDAAMQEVNQYSYGQ